MKRGIKIKWSSQSKMGEGLAATGRVFQPPTDPHGHKSKAGDIGYLHLHFDPNNERILHATDPASMQTLVAIYVNGGEFEAALAKAKANPTHQEYYSGDQHAGGDEK